jgi:hypothetical protein
MGKWYPTQEDLTARKEHRRLTKHAEMVSETHSIFPPADSAPLLGFRHLTERAVAIESLVPKRFFPPVDSTSPTPSPSNHLDRAMAPAALSKKKCGILGATGTGISPLSNIAIDSCLVVGQRFIALIGNSHPYFTIHALGASPRSAGKLYPDAVNWKLADDIPEAVHDIIVRTCEPTVLFAECDVIFSGLDADVAGPIGTLPIPQEVRKASNLGQTD